MKATPCQLMAEMAIHDHTDHYHGSVALTSQDTLHLENYRGKSGFFLKKMIINDKMNLNRWKVTWDAIKQDVWGFIGKPVVLTPDKDHPPVSEQEDYRVGNIIDIQLDEVNKIAYQISEIFDEKAQKMILDGKVKFGSPTVLIYSEATREQKFKGTEYQEDILHRFRPAHDALVENPAYGEHVDYIPAVCTGDGVGCGLKLLEVSASVEYRKRYESEVNDNNTSQLTIVPFVKSKLNKRFSSDELANIVGHIMQAKEGADESCISKNIRQQMNSHHSMSHDQAIAIAYSICGESGEEDKMEDVFMPKLANELMKYYKS